MTTYAYIQVSPDGKDRDPQKLTIEDYCERKKISVDDWIEIFISSGKTVKQRLISELLNKLRRDDLLIVAELSKLGRSVGQVISIVNEILVKEVDFISIKESVYITFEDENKMDNASKAIANVFSVLAKLESDLKSQSTKEGLVKASQKGKRLGRPPGGSKLDGKFFEIKSSLRARKSVSAIARELKVDRQTVKRFIEAKNLKPPAKNEEKAKNRLWDLNI
jgi:DNA invertase Pin-like site-specific DNA recombinase